MTSEQVMLALMALTASLVVGGCSAFGTHPRPTPRLNAPYAQPQVWAVAPLRNESGSRQADGARLADRLAGQLERAAGIQVVPVNRVLAAMDALQMGVIGSPAQARKLRKTLGVDGLVVGTLSAYDPYDPPKMGLAIELYLGPRRSRGPRLDPRKLERAPTDEMTRPPDAQTSGQPVSVVSALFDGGDPATRRWLRRYAVDRGVVREIQDDADDWRRYRISMDLYTNFVSYAISERLLAAERTRLGHRPSRHEKPLS